VAVIFGRDLMQCAGAESALAGLINLALVSGALHGDCGGLFPVEEQGNAFGPARRRDLPGVPPRLH